jgi:dienelactone hydrolase
MKSKSFIERFIRNPVIQTFVILISGGWIILEITEYFIGNFGLNENARKVLLITLLSILPVALFLTWFINRKGSTPVEEGNLKKAEKSQIPEKRRTLFTNPWFAIPVLILFILAGYAVVRSIHYKAKVKWAKTEILVEVENQYSFLSSFDAYNTLQKAAKYISDDPEFKKLHNLVSTNISILSEPLGAKVYIKEYSAIAEDWKLLGVTPLDSIEMPSASFYRCLMIKPGYDSVMAILSTNPDTLYIKLFENGTAPPGMVHVSGYGDESVSNFLADKNDFFIDKYEVTNEQFKEFVDNNGYQKPAYWEQEFINIGEKLSTVEAMKLFVDKSGRPGPSTWEAGDYPDGQADYPVNGISWYEAAAFAKFAGKDLPTEEHWSTAAGFYLNEFRYGFGHKLIPVSNFNNEGPEPVGLNPGLNLYGTYDMAGNVREWCWNKTQDGRLLRGGAWNDVSYMYRYLSQLSSFNRSPKNGIRCVKYIERDKIPEDAFEPIELGEIRDYYKEQPVSDEIFEIYKKQFLYDSTALNANLEKRDDSSEDWIMEKISFDAAYENERMNAYIFLPKNSKPPFQTLIFFPGSYAKRTDSFPDKWFHYFCDYLLKNGIAVVMPIYHGTYERRGSLGPGLHLSNESHLYAEYLIKWGKDLSRSIDYLETRPDIDTGKIAYYSHSWGGVIGGILPAVEGRLKLCVHVTGGFGDKALPEADAINYISRIKTPVLMLNGKYDLTFPLAADVKPFYDLLGTLEKDKALKVYDSDHWVPTNEMVRETLGWLEKYFGPVIK